MALDFENHFELAPFKQPIIPAWPYSLCWEELSGELSMLENVDTKSGNYPSECRLNLISFFNKKTLKSPTHSSIHQEIVKVKTEKTVHAIK